MNFQMVRAELKRIDLEHIRPKFTLAIAKVLQGPPKTSIRSIAKATHLDHSHLAKVIRGDAKLTVAYLLPLVMRGYLMVQDLRPNTTQNGREDLAWKMMQFAEQWDRIMKLIMLEESGIDIDAILDAHLPKKSRPPGPN